MPDATDQEYLAALPDRHVRESGHALHSVPCDVCRMFRIVTELQPAPVPAEEAEVTAEEQSEDPADDDDPEPAKRKSGPAKKKKK